MLKPTVKRGLMLDFIPNEIPIAVQTDRNRVYKLDNKSISGGYILYVMSREFRLEDNWALIFASKLARKYQKNLKIFILLEESHCSKNQESFLTEGLNFLKKNLERNDIEFEVGKTIPDRIKDGSGAIIFDFNPINLKENVAKTINCAALEVDSHNIIPARFLSNKQEYSAATLRRKIYASIGGFLTEFPNPYNTQKSEAYTLLGNFIENKLDYYAEQKNNPIKDVTSHLSPYMHFGFISSQRIALEILKSKSSRENKEAFLEELTVRKELSDNFCLYNKDYKTLKGAPNWAKESLNVHRNDFRTYIYNLKEFEGAKTHDLLWNAIQANLTKNGKIHGYLRMYWAKKILEWSKTPEKALEIAIYLNDTYALDGNDPNGYVGVLWSVGGVHDRAFSNRMVTGKIRYFSEIAIKKHFNIDEYVKSLRGRN